MLVIKQNIQFAKNWEPRSM